MYPISHAATALVLREKYQLSRTWFLLLAVQLPGLLLVALYFAGLEHSLRYSGFLLSTIMLAFASWLVLNKALHKTVMCWAFGVGIISYVVLDLFTPDIPVAPYKPLWLNLYSSPMLATAVEISYGAFCWRLYRGRKALLATILLFNLLDFPLLFHNRFPAMASFMGRHPAAMAAFVLLQIVAASFFVLFFAKKPLSKMNSDAIKLAVSERYGKVATDPQLGFGFPIGRRYAESVGYPVAFLDGLPPSLWKSFTGAGNPHEFINVRLGETVLDMGCGAGLDLYIYSQAVGPGGTVYGLDISGNMIRKADANMKAVGAANVRLLHAPSDRIPLPDNSVDLVAANGIFNLSPDKDAVMREVYRVLKPGGRTTFAEIMLTAPFPPGEQKSIDDWFKCIGGALTKEEFLGRMAAHGFQGAKALWTGKNARASHELSVCAVINAAK